MSKLYDTTRIYNNLFKDYLLYRETSSSSEVHMNNFYTPEELALYLKSLFVSNPQAIFFCFLINLFDRFVCKDMRYYTISHALTLYFLKVLKRYGLVDIIELTKLHNSTEMNLDAYYKLLNNSNQKQKYSVYTIGFIKLRPLKSSDIELIKTIEKNFKIPEGLIIYREKNGSLTASLNYALIMKNYLNDSTRPKAKKFTTKRK